MISELPVTCKKTNHPSQFCLRNTKKVPRATFRKARYPKRGNSQVRFVLPPGKAWKLMGSLEASPAYCSLIGPLEHPQTSLDAPLKTNYQ